jgi:hydroxyethylthiazole kinase
MPALDLATTLKVMRERVALVHHITNWVTIEGCAQVTRRWGCLPVMAHAHEEVREMVGLASALVLNIGTLTRDLVDTMLEAATAANAKGIPVVLDAVGVGATKFRTTQAARLLAQSRIDVIKGNAGEIASLAGVSAEVRGVESINVAGDIGAAARDLAKKHKSVVVVSGSTDIVTDGARGLVLKCGHPIMGTVVGTGCMSSSTVGCFVSVGPGHLELAAHAMAAFGTAGSRAVSKSRGPGDFVAAMLNEIEAMSADPAGLSVDAAELPIH